MKTMKEKIKNLDLFFRSANSFGEYIDLLRRSSVPILDIALAEEELRNEKFDTIEITDQAIYGYNGCLVSKIEEGSFKLFGISQ